ncbi:low temperature requirement protein A [Gordonia sp. NPDC003950]
MGWVTWILLPLSFTAALVRLVIIWILDLGGPVIAEFNDRRRGGGFPWHAHHIAERYGLLAIIAIGESITGALAAAQMISNAQGRTVESMVALAAGVLISFSLWWTYFVIPSGPILDVRRDNVIPWAYMCTSPVVATVLAAVGWPLWACLLVVLVSPLSVIVLLDVVINDAADNR